VCSSHCKDKCVSVNCHYVPRAGQSLSLRRLVAFLVEAFFSSSNDCEYFFCSDIDLSYGVVLRITEVYEVLILSKNVAQTLRVMELRLSVGSIDEADFAIANLVFKFHCVFIDNNDAIVRSVSYHDQVSI